MVPKKTASTHNRVRHRRYCFLLSINLLNRTSVLPQIFESIAYGINEKKSTKESINASANETKSKNHELVHKKVKYNMMMLHKASLSGELFKLFLF